MRINLFRKQLPVPVRSSPHLASLVYLEQSCCSDALDVGVLVWQVSCILIFFYQMEVTPASITVEWQPIAICLTLPANQPPSLGRCLSPAISSSLFATALAEVYILPFADQFISGSKTRFYTLTVGSLVVAFTAGSLEVVEAPSALSLAPISYKCRSFGPRRCHSCMWMGHALLLQPPLDASKRIQRMA
jgi:hypothetical protein